MGKEKTSNKTEGAEREPYWVKVNEHEPFDPINQVKYCSSTELCQKVSEIFKSAYADYEGCIYEINQQGRGYISLFFNHGEPDDPVRANAVSRVQPDKKNVPANETVRRIRDNDRRNRAGDKFFLTTEGEEGIERFIAENNPQIRNRKGEIMWDKISAEVSQQQRYFNQPPIMLTKISMIDPVKLVEEIYGQTNEEGEVMVYDVHILRSMPQMVAGNFQAQYMLAIDRVSEKEVAKLCNKFGIAPTGGLDIIR